MKDIIENSIYKEDLRLVAKEISLERLKNSSVLITGGLGLICSAVVDVLIFYNQSTDANIKIYVADINEEFYESRYGKYGCVECLKYDATKPIEFDVDVDYIIHGAGLASPELYVSRPVETMLSNFDGVHRLLDYSSKHNVKRLLYISSSEVYGIKESEDAFCEDKFGSVDINSVRSSYSEAKRAAEVLCKSYSSEYNIDTVIVRPGHIYGPTASPKDKRISSEFAYRASRGEDLLMKSSGLQKRSYCYSVDCASAILFALINGVKGESYNIGHDEVTRIRDMAFMIAEAGGVKLTVKDPTVEEMAQFNPMNNSSLNNEKIKSIGYRDVFSVSEGLEHTVKILRDIY